MRKILPITFFILLIDIVSKQLALHYLDVDKSVVIIKNFFSLTLAYNDGVAFSMLEGSLVFIVLVSVVIIFFLSSFAKSKALGGEQIAYCLVIGGAIGNLVDRIMYGYVIDFLDFNIFGYDYPIFNFADCFIVIGVFLIFIFSFRKRGV